MPVSRIRDGLAEAIAAGRNRRLATGIISGVLVKGIAFFLTLVTVPMTLHYLGVERYGVWVTMISLLAWIGLIDLGLANGLTPVLSRAFGSKRDDLARQYIATAFWGLCGMTGVVGLAISFAWQFISWDSLFNVQSPRLATEVTDAMAFAILLFLLKLPLSINQRVLLSYQEGKVANICQLLVSISGVLGIYVVTKTEGGLLYLVLGYSGTQAVVLMGIAVWMYTRFKPSLRPLVVPKLSYVKEVFSFGGLFFLMQIGSLLVFQKDLVMITHFLGAKATASYSIVWQLFLYINMLNLLIAPYFSPGFGDAHASGDSSWVRIAFKNYLRATVMIAIPATILVAIFHRDLIRLWVGGAIQVSGWTVFWLATWTILFSALGPCIALLQGVGRLKRFTTYYVAASASALVLSYFMIPLLGPYAGVMSTTMSYLLILVWPTIKEVKIVIGKSQNQPYSMMELRRDQASELGTEGTM